SLEDEQQRLLLALAQEYPLEGVEGALAALGRIELNKRAVVRQGIQERQQSGKGVLEGRVERQHLASDLGADGADVITLLDVAVALEQVDDREVRCRLAIGHRGTLQHPPALRVVGVDALIEQARLPDTS